MWNKCRGLTLVELVIAIVIMGVGLAGVLSAYQIAVRGSADPLINKQMVAIAEEMMEEVSLHSYTAAPNGASPACGRSSFNDIDDYNGYASTGVCDIAGNALPSLAGYNVGVAISNTVLVGVAAKRIAVTVSRGANTVTLVTYRSNWAQ